MVVATVGRPRQLARSLAAYGELAAGTPPFEVIVVLDGPDPASRAVAEGAHPFPVAVVEHPPAGTGPTKHLGAARARGELLLFLNDDTRPHPDCLRAHVEEQEENGPAVVVGRVEWETEREVTPYMRWLAPAGHQFNFERLPTAGGPIGWDACWGAHVGLPRSWYLEEPFDPTFGFAALEDIEWGYRLARRGRPLRYLPTAVCFHDHHYSGPRDYRSRARTSGRAAVAVVRRHPELAYPLLLRPAAAALVLTLRAAIVPRRWRRETLWDLEFRWRQLAASVAGLPALLRP